MLNLMKYEIIKLKNTKFILGGFLLVAELIFLFGLLTNGEAATALGIIGLSVTSIIGFAMVALEAVSTYFQDMKEKRGIMLFMTPHSEFEILGSKILSGILTVLVWCILVGVLAFIDMSLLAVTFNDFVSFIDIIQALFEALTAVEINWATTLFTVIDLFFSWCAFLTSAFLAITISMTVLSRWKAKGLISFVLFIVVNIVYSRIVSLLHSLLHVAEDVEFSMEVSEQSAFYLSQPSMASNAITLCVTVVFVAICFYCTGTLLKKKLAL